MDKWFALLAQTEPADNRQVAIPVLIAQIRQQTRPLADHHQQAAPAGVVFLVRPQVLGQLGDPSGEQRDLHFRGARVLGVEPELINNLGFAVFRDRHLGPHRLRRGQLLPKVSAIPQHFDVMNLASTNWNSRGVAN